MKYFTSNQSFKKCTNIFSSWKSGKTYSIVTSKVALLLQRLLQCVYTDKKTVSLCKIDVSILIFKRNIYINTVIILHYKKWLD